MRVLMLNAFHWPKGGVERTVFDETRWLEAAGHEVGHFATVDPRNKPSRFERHFAPSADFGEGTPAWKQLPLLPRAVWSGAAARALAGLLAEWRPDVAHLHAPSRYLTPSVISELERSGVPMVMTLHDFKPWCTNRLLYAHGAVCERCKGGAHWHAVTTGCVQRSRLKSLVGAIEAYEHDRRRAYAPVRAFIAPSRFACDKAVEMGAEPSRVRVLLHGIDAAVEPASRAGLPARYAFYAGRLSDEKGVAFLPAVARAIAPIPLLVAGGGPREAWLRVHAPANLRVLGFVEPDVLAAARGNASVVLVPSVFPEMFGYAVAEAQLDGRAVVASRIGAVGELVEHEGSGLLVPPGDEAALRTATQRALAEPERAAAWGRAGRAHAQGAGLSPAAHVAGLLAAYEAARG